jgi:hypothetical protein
MALATSVTGGGILVSRRISSQRYFIVTPVGRYEIEETQTVEQREWVALTQAAAVDYADANAQPASGTHTYDVAEDNRVVGGYKVTRTFELTDSALVPPPEPEPEE